MASPYDVIDFDSVALDGSTGMVAVMDARDSWSVTASLDFQARPGVEPIVMSASPDQRQIELRIIHREAVISGSNYRKAILTTVAPSSAYARR